MINLETIPSEAMKTNKTGGQQHESQVVVFKTTPIEGTESQTTVEKNEKGVEENIELTPGMLMNDEVEGKNLRYIDAINTACEALNQRRAQLTHGIFVNWVEKVQNATAAQEIEGIVVELSQAQDNTETDVAFDAQSENPSENSERLAKERKRENDLNRNPKSMDIFAGWAAA